MAVKATHAWAMEQHCRIGSRSAPWFGPSGGPRGLHRDYAAHQRAAGRPRIAFARWLQSRPSDRNARTKGQFLFGTRIQLLVLESGQLEEDARFAALNAVESVGEPTSG